MKTFKYITAFAVFALLSMIVANVFYMYGLYNSLKEDTIRTAQNCLRRADFMEMMVRLHRFHYWAVDDSVMTVANFDIISKRSIEGHYLFNEMPEQLPDKLAEVMHRGFDPEDRKTDMHVLDSLFRLEMQSEDLHPLYVATYNGDTILDDGLWHCSLRYHNKDKVIYTASFSPLVGHVLKQMAGIIATSAGFLLVAAFLIWYLLHTVRRMRSMEEMKDDFTHNMTHELKAPLSAACAATDSLLSYYDPTAEERNKQMLSIIKKRLYLLTDMVNNILTVSMRRTRETRLEIIPVNVGIVIDNVIETIRVKNIKPTTFKTTIEPKNLEVDADLHHFTNVITNLVDNAVKYSGDSVTVTIEANEEKLTVSDNGHGISSEALPHIFEKYFREASGDLFTTNGFGLGLYYISQIVPRMGWRISVASRKGHGTTFTIHFSKKPAK